MALWNIKNVKLAGVAGAVPDKVVDTHDFDFFNREEADVFIDTVGIEKRYVATDDICASDLCMAAAENLIAKLGWNKEEIDILSFASVTGDYRTPPTSCILQERLGLSDRCFTLDIPMGCCGCVYSITVVGNMLSSGNLKKALLLIGDTHDFDFFNREEADVFIDTVGIEKRYVATDDICASDLCMAAAENLIAKLGWNKEEIDILSFASVTGDYRTPPTSCILQERLGLSDRCFTLDIPMGCCGCVYSITVVGNMLSSGNLKKALLLIGDTATRMGSPYDKSRVPLFGDCGTALALEYHENAEPIIVDFHTFGKGFRALMTPAGGFRHPVTPESFEYEDFGNGIVRAPVHTLINGMDVLSFAISKPPKSIDELLKYCALDKEKDIDYFLIHQANKLIIDRIVKKLKLETAKVPCNIQNFGNLGGSSIPMLMVTDLKEQLQDRKLSLLCSAFGLGLTWGTMFLKTEPMVVCDLVKIECSSGL